MTARVLVIGLDAMDAGLVECWAAEGAMPTFTRLAAEGRRFILDNSMETLPGAIWPELMTGRSCGQVPLYYHPLQLKTGEARARKIRADEINWQDFFWVRASDAGRRVAAIDMCQSVLAPHLNGIQMIEWGVHDRTFETASDPPELIENFVASYGPNPVPWCDRHGQTEAGYRELLVNLVKAVEQKADILVDVLNRERWDLVTGAFCETHCVGHQFFHFMDEAHRWNDGAVPALLRGGVKAVYQAIDAGLARVMAAAGEKAHILVFTSHGMGPAVKGAQLLPEILVRLGLGSGSGAVPSGTLRRLQKLVSHAPRPVQPALRWLAHTGPVKAVQREAGCLIDPLESPRTRAAAVRNNRCGAIRLNLKGREPFGCVEPGAEAKAMVDLLRRELLTLLDPRSGEPIVTRVITAKEAFGPVHHPDVPDILVSFRQDLGPIERCISPAVGDVHVPFYHPNIPRSGDHTQTSRLWWLNPDVPAPGSTATANVLDVAPTVLTVLGVPVPSNVDGRAIA